MSKNKIRLRAIWLIGGIVLLTVALVSGGCTTTSNSTNQTATPTPTPTATLTPTPTATPTATPDGACSFTKSYATTDVYGQALLKYFTAINDGDYAIAYAMLSEESKAKYGSEANFVAYMKDNITCFNIVGIDDLADMGQCPMVSASLGMQCFTVTLEGKYNQDKVSVDYLVHSDPHMEGDRVENAEITVL